MRDTVRRDIPREYARTSGAFAPSCACAQNAPSKILGGDYDNPRARLANRGQPERPARRGPPGEARRERPAERGQPREVSPGRPAKRPAKRPAERPHDEHNTRSQTEKLTTGAHSSAIIQTSSRTRQECWNELSLGRAHKTPTYAWASGPHMDGRMFPLARMTLALSLSLVALSLSVHLGRELEYEP